ncbi:hypothetical protein BaRGS_00031645 [Batillaria attramentaria]|uniref:Uncharacterized protein n=1 Tax=Batillaria attramentaria TaxID=370345 RepID=A0ABD0JR95_9CAEN
MLVKLFFLPTLLSEISLHGLICEKDFAIALRGKLAPRTPVQEYPQVETNDRQTLGATDIMQGEADP